MGTHRRARTAQVGQRQTVQQEEYFCHAFNKDGLVGIAFVDEAYPARAGFCVVSRRCVLRYSTLICRRAPRFSTLICL